MNYVGLLCVKGEADVFAEWADQQDVLLGFDGIVAIAGDPESERALGECNLVERVFRDADLLAEYGAPTPDGGRRFRDSCRQPALDWIADRYGEDTWVTLLHADEFWVDDPILAAVSADYAGATYALWGEFRHFLHTSDRETLDLSLPVQERVRWCCGPFFEVRQFRLREHRTYQPGRDHSVLPVGLPGRRWPLVPRYRHFPYRSPDQCALAYADKCASRYWQPDHAWLASGDPFVERLPEPRNSPLAAWDNVLHVDDPRDLPAPNRYLPRWWTG